MESLLHNSATEEDQLTSSFTEPANLQTKDPLVIIQVLWSFKCKQGILTEVLTSA